MGLIQSTKTNDYAYRLYDEDELSGNNILCKNERMLKIHAEKRLKDDQGI